MRAQFTKYFITGISAVILDILTLYLLKEYAHLKPVWAVVVNQVVLLNYVFFINKYWSFKSQGMAHREMVRFLILAGVNYLISVAWMYVFNEKFGINYLLVRLANVALAVAWNFLLYRFWVYVAPKENPPAAASTAENLSKVS